MCNLYSMTKSQDAIREVAKVWEDRTGNLQALPEIYRDKMAPTVREGPDGRVLSMMRWGMPSPKSKLPASGRDPGLAIVRNTKSGHWRRWLGPDNRCVVPFTSFCENDDRTKAKVWFALDESLPLAFFAGIWTEWTSIRKVRDGPTDDTLFAFLTTEPNATVAAVHKKAMPVILTTQAEVDLWLSAPMDEALTLQRPLEAGALQII
ncbi:SOS response-associated peptidase family protein [Roseobacter sp. YSTF-M11]|uniref:Abasic site processing protein n=1 Tax=Roseobacter insulae TaxID=2859783 RepID=A0A9X1FXH9_9RHOB|nr:SOS response-associated peptidase family protein [Roseobacter insulae]MBW4709599.1 SOS response-associated peptidase family protein [Roseobacter insulae]